MGFAGQIHGAPNSQFSGSVANMLVPGTTALQGSIGLHALMGRGGLAAKEEPTQSISACGIAAAQQQRAHSVYL